MALILEYLWTTCYIYNLINSKLYIVSQYIIENTVPESVYVVKEVKGDSYVLVYFILLFKYMKTKSFYGLHFFLNT